MPAYWRPRRKRSTHDDLATRVGSISTDWRLQPDFTPAADTDSVDRLLQAVAATPTGQTRTRSGTAREFRVGRAHRGWIDSYAWVDPRGGEVWVLTEGFDQHQDEWPSLIDAFIGAQQ